MEYIILVIIKAKLLPYNCKHTISPSKLELGNQTRLAILVISKKKNQRSSLVSTVKAPMLCKTARNMFSLALPHAKFPTFMASQCPFYHSHHSTKTSEHFLLFLNKKASKSSVPKLSLISC